MTKRKQQTSLTARTRAEQPAVSGSQPAAAKGNKLDKVPVSKRAKSEQSPSPSSPKAALGQTAAAEEVDIDNIFKQARAKKQLAAKADQVRILSFRTSMPVLTSAASLTPARFMQKAKTVGKPAPVVGSKDDLFGTGQPRQRRYVADICRCASCWCAQR